MQYRSWPPMSTPEDYKTAVSPILRRMSLLLNKTFVIDAYNSTIRNQHLCVPGGPTPWSRRWHEEMNCWISGLNILDLSINSVTEEMHNILLSVAPNLQLLISGCNLVNRYEADIASKPTVSAQNLIAQMVDKRWTCHLLRGAQDCRFPPFTTKDEALVFCRQLRAEYEVSKKFGGLDGDGLYHIYGQLDRVKDVPFNLWVQKFSQVIGGLGLSLDWDADFSLPPGASNYYFLDRTDIQPSLLQMTRTKDFRSVVTVVGGTWLDLDYSPIILTNAKIHFKLDDWILGRMITSSMSSMLTECSDKSSKMNRWIKELGSFTFNIERCSNDRLFSRWRSPNLIVEVLQEYNPIGPSDGTPLFSIRVEFDGKAYREELVKSDCGLREHNNLISLSSEQNKLYLLNIQQCGILEFARWLISHSKQPNLMWQSQAMIESGTILGRMTAIIRRLRQLLGNQDCGLPTDLVNLICHYLVDTCPSQLEMTELFVSKIY